MDRTTIHIDLSYAKEHPIAFWLAALATIAGVVLILSPSPDAASDILPRWLQIVQGFFAIIGGLMAQIGLITQRKDIEGAGFLFLSGAVIVNEISAVQLHGWDVTGTFNWLVFAGVAFGCIRRTYSLVNVSNGKRGWRAWI